MFNENREMMNFLDKYFDIFKIDVDFYPHNLEQIKDNMAALKHINFKLRKFFENNGLYSWEINSCIINGSESIRLSMTSKLDWSRLYRR
jgi:hypothetical protein